MGLRKSQTGQSLTTTRCGGDPPAIFLSAQISMALQLVGSTWGGWFAVGSEMKSTGLYLAKMRLRKKQPPLLLWGQTCSLHIAWLMQKVGWSSMDLTKCLPQANHPKPPTQVSRKRPVQVWYHSRSIQLTMPRKKKKKHKKCLQNHLRHTLAVCKPNGMKRWSTGHTVKRGRAGWASRWIEPPRMITHGGQRMRSRMSQ